MEKIEIINSFSKMFIIHLFTYYMFIILINYKNNSFEKTSMIAFFSIIIAIVYTIIIQNTNQVFILPIIYIDYTIIIYVLLKKKISYCLFIANISTIMTYIIYCISIFISGLILFITYPKLGYNNPINILSISIIMTCIFIYISKIKRLKNGIGFLKNPESIKKIYVTINLLTIAVFIAFMFPRTNSKNVIFYNFLECSIIISTIIIVYWLQSQITQYYKKNMKDRTIEVQKLEIEENKKEIKDIKEENLKLAEVVHRYNNRLSAIEMALEETINKNTNLEFSNELSIILKETKEISKNFAKESEIIKNTLPTTNIPGIDNMFKYMQNEAINNNIKFDLKLTDSIHDLIDNIIPKDKFETMLGDHLRDAIIAVNNSKNSYKSILVTLGIVENCYELSIYDTGIEFEINTLLKLGKERITTHKETGGSGIGFMTTFDTLRKTKGSLIIEEYDSNNSSYTKSINIRFDGKNEYRIYSYRAEKIKRQNKDKNIIVKEI